MKKEERIRKKNIWVALDLVFFLLHLDLELAKNHLKCAKKRIWELESKKSTSCSAPFTKSIPPSKMTNFRVLSSKPKKIEEEPREKKGVAATYIGTDLTEVETLK